MLESARHKKIRAFEGREKKGIFGASFAFASLQLAKEKSAQNHLVSGARMRFIIHGSFLVPHQQNHSPPPLMHAMPEARMPFYDDHCHSNFDC